MARKQIYTVQKDGNFYYVRFDLEGKRYRRSTGKDNQKEALEEAKNIYLKALQGELEDRSSLALLEAVSQWIASLQNVLSPLSIRSIEYYASGQWLKRWKTVSQLKSAEISKYQNERLGEVLRKTVAKELSALRFFVRWLIEKEWLDELEFPRLPMRAVGTKASGNRKEKATLLTEAEVRLVLQALPYFSPRLSKGGEQILCRSFFEILWETALRPITVEKLVYGEHWETGKTSLKINASIDKVRFARELPLSERAVEVLESIDCEEGKPIFGHYSRRDLLKNAGKKVLCVEKSRTFSVYDFRHSRISYWVSQGYPLNKIAYLTGHKSITTTAIYVQSDKEAATEIVRGKRNSQP